MLYTTAGITLLAPVSFRLHTSFPELFPWPLVYLQLALHISTLALALVVLLRLTEHVLGAYTGMLILLLVHGAIAFVRVLLYRRD